MIANVQVASSASNDNPLRKSRDAMVEASKGTSIDLNLRGKWYMFVFGAESL